MRQRSERYTSALGNDLVELMIDVATLLLAQKMAEHLFFALQKEFLGQKIEGSSKDLLEQSHPSPLPFSCVKT
jgi:hypothetical protein